MTQGSDIQADRGLPVSDLIAGAICLAASVTFFLRSVVPVRLSQLPH
ncbi:hypothetical protein [Paracoccus yeei]|nr:hypothetical protein [Paracoccus yeei]